MNILKNYIQQHVWAFLQENSTADASGRKKGNMSINLILYGFMEEIFLHIFCCCFNRVASQNLINFFSPNTFWEGWLESDGRSLWDLERVTWKKKMLECKAHVVMSFRARVACETLTTFIWNWSDKSWNVILRIFCRHFFWVFSCTLWQKNPSAIELLRKAFKKRKIEIFALIPRKFNKRHFSTLQHFSRKSPFTTTIINIKGYQRKKIEWYFTIKLSFSYFSNISSSIPCDWEFLFLKYVCAGVWNKIFSSS